MSRLVKSEYSLGERLGHFVSAYDTITLTSTLVFSFAVSLAAQYSEEELFDTSNISGSIRMYLFHCAISLCIGCSLHCIVILSLISYHINRSIGNAASNSAADYLENTYQYRQHARISFGTSLILFVGSLCVLYWNGLPSNLAIINTIIIALFIIIIATSVNRMSHKKIVQKAEKRSYEMAMNTAINHYEMQPMPVTSAPGGILRDDGLVTAPANVVRLTPKHSESAIPVNRYINNVGPSTYDTIETVMADDTTRDIRISPAMMGRSDAISREVPNHHLMPHGQIRITPMIPMIPKNRNRISISNPEAGMINYTPAMQAVPNEHIIDVGQSNAIARDIPNHPHGGVIRITQTVDPSNGIVRNIPNQAVVYYGGPIAGGYNSAMVRANNEDETKL